MATNGFASSNPQTHVVIVPLMAQGHLIPAMDIATLLASRGVLVTVVTTPVNSARFLSAHLPFRLAELPFPASSVGLPDGCENLDLLHNEDHFVLFFQATALLRNPLASLLRQCQPLPTCLISDMCHPWTKDVASDLKIPRLIFHGTSCFALLCYHAARTHGLLKNPEPFVIPEIPHHIVATNNEVAFWFVDQRWEELNTKTLESEEATDGFVLNSFDFLEGASIAKYIESVNKKVFCIGPLCLSSKDLAAHVRRGGQASVDEQKCVDWLNGKKPRSVIYVSFGSLTYLFPNQLIEIGMGLEASGVPFILVIKNTEASPPVRRWLSEEGFEERNKETGMVIKGWAPQALILSHPAVGGYVTHCGWNSVLEGVSAGLPAIAWPHFADQLLNKRLVVDVLGIGVDAGVRKEQGIMADKPVEAVGREEVEKAVRELMDGGEEGEERRRKAKELGEAARKALEDGGSSYKDLTELLRFISHCDS
ncbi:UDP-glycosyltransferase 73C6-like [Typha latifolia]|uniref:UDP-glycosyltransferase 73C6-like n=1 Tax=Typha latifolia TaxID=4733 RepID=UPI003C2E669A